MGTETIFKNVIDSEETKTYLCNAINQFQKMKELEHLAEQVTKPYQLLMLRKSEIEEKMEIDQEKFEKMTELEKEWEIFRRAELKEQYEKWIEIKTKLDKRKTSDNTADCKN